MILNTTEADNGQDLIITDTLPSGQKFVANTVEGYYFGNESYVSDTNWNGFTFVKGQNPTYEIKENADGSETLRIVIHKFGYSSQLPRVVVYYKVDIKDDKAWGDPFVENRLYTNRAEWEGHGTTSNGANVHRKVEELTKDSVQLDRDGNPLTEATKDKASGTIRYYVTINPQAKDLDESHDTLTLVDELSASKYNPQLKLDSMKVYSYEAFAPYHVGAELPSSSYSLTYDAANAKFEITVPDEKAMILIYDYQLDEKFGDGSKISNKIKLDNNWEKTEETRLIQADSAATANKAKVEIYKVDSKNYMKKLPGTVFEMKSWKQSKWLDLGYPTYTTDEDGKIQFDLTGPTKTIEYDTLYRLGEKSAPKGYTPESKWTYIIVKSKGETNEQAFAKANAATANDVNKSDGSKVKMEDVTFFEQKGGIVYIENEYNELKVRKVWTDPNGAVTAPPANTEISVKLVQWTTKPDGYKVTVNNMDTRTTRRLSDQGYGTTSFYVKKGSPITFRVSNYKAYAAEIDIPEMSVSTKMNFTTANGANTATYTVSAVNSDLTVNMFAMQEHNYTDGIAENYVEAPDALDARRGYTEKVLNAANNWEFSWTGLPKVNDAGKPVLYTVEEQKVLQNGVDIKNRYGVTYTNNNGSLTGDIVITNKATRDLTQFVFIKRWLKDNGEPAGINWPFNQKIHVKLGRTLNNRVDTSFNLEYDIELVGVSGTPSIQCTTPGVVNGIGQVPKLDRAYDGSDFKFVITGLDKNEATETTAYNYFISETSAEGYDTPQYSVPNSRDAYAGWTQTYDHGTIINTPLTKVEFAKEWADASGKVINAPVGATATFQLYANGQPMADKIITLDGATDINGEFVGWSGRFENLHKRDSNGKDILYTVREITSFLGYSAEEDASFENGWKITNKPDQPTDTEISVTKIWKDSKGNLISNEELTRKNVAATFRLARYQEGSKSEDKEVNGWNRQKVTLYASEADDHNWSYTWTKLPRNYLGSDGEMHTYTYKVKEIGVEYSGDTAGVNTKSGKFVDKLGMWTITFKETDEVIENGEIKAPASSEITNQLNGTKVSFTKQWLNASSSQTEWAKDKQGKEIPITVTLKRYIDGAEDSKFTEKAITYTVNSNGLETAAGSTSGSMTAQKYPLIVTSGKGTGRVTFEINDLPRTDPDKGVTYEYRLVESEVEGYKTTYLDKDNKDVTANGYVKDGETIQNKQNPAVQLPSTGGTGTSRYIGSGMVLLMAALLFLYINNKNRIWKEEH